MRLPERLPERQRIHPGAEGVLQGPGRDHQPALNDRDVRDGLVAGGGGHDLQPCRHLAEHRDHQVHPRVVARADPEERVVLGVAVAVVRQVARLVRVAVLASPLQAVDQTFGHEPLLSLAVVLAPDERLSGLALVVDPRKEGADEGGPERAKTERQELLRPPHVAAQPDVHTAQVEPAGRELQEYYGAIALQEALERRELKRVSNIYD